MLRSLVLSSLTLVSASLISLACSDSTTEDNSNENTPGGTGSSASDLEFIATKFCAAFERCDVWLYRNYGVGQECVELYKNTQAEALALTPNEAPVYASLRKGLETCSVLETRACPPAGHFSQLRWLAESIWECLDEAIPQEGDPCDDASCGDGLKCNGASASVCGVCEAAPLGWCAESQDCPEDAHCDAETNTCVKLGASGDSCDSLLDCSSGECRSGKCAEPAGAGEPCDSENSCELALFCKAGSCVAPGGEGDACESHEECRYSFACSSGSCTKLPSSAIPIGGTCRYSGCEDGAYCDIIDNTCKSGKLGEPCDYRCAASFICVDSVCSAPQGQGAACDADGECASGRCFADLCAESVECVPM